MKWYVLDNNWNLDLPEWARTLGIDEDGIVFITAAIAQIPEEDVRVRLETDDDPEIPMAIYDEHYYMPSRWLARVFPEIADICQLFEQQAEKAKAINAP